MVHELRKMSKMLKDFPPTITIPTNIKFIGTLNQDETTLDISPKVVDRAYFIRFGVEKANGNSEEKVTIQYQDIKDYKEASVSDNDNLIVQYKGITKIPTTNVKNQPEIAKLVNLVNLETIQYSKRVEKQTFGHPEYSDWCKRLDEKAINDFFVAATILPRISKDDTDSEFSDLQKKLDTLFENDAYKISKKIYEAIKVKNSGVIVGINYWRS